MTINSMAYYDIADKIDAFYDALSLKVYEHYPQDTIYHSTIRHNTYTEFDKHKDELKLHYQALDASEHKTELTFEKPVYKFLSDAVFRLDLLPLNLFAKETCFFWSSAYQEADSFDFYADEEAPIYNCASRLVNHLSGNIMIAKNLEACTELLNLYYTEEDFHQDLDNRYDSYFNIAVNKIIDCATKLAKHDADLVNKSITKYVQRDAEVANYQLSNCQDNNYNSPQECALPAPTFDTALSGVINYIHYYSTHDAQ